MNTEIESNFYRNVRKQMGFRWFFVYMKNPALEIEFKNEVAQINEILKLNIDYLEIINFKGRNSHQEQTNKTLYVKG